MQLTYLHLAAGGLTLFLIGVNIALLAHLKQDFLSWFQFKILAVTILLVYVGLSLVFGGVGLDRTLVGTFALVLDAVALWRMWESILTINGGTFPPLKRNK